MEFEPKPSGSRARVLDRYAPLPLWYVWIISWHLKIKRDKIKTQISSLLELKSELILPHGKNLPLFHGNVAFSSPHYSLWPFNTEVHHPLPFVIGLTLLFSYRQPSSVLFTHLCDLLGPSTRLFLKMGCTFALITHISWYAEVPVELTPLENCY